MEVGGRQYLLFVAFPPSRLPEVTGRARILLFTLPTLHFDLHTYILATRTSIPFCHVLIESRWALPITPLSMIAKVRPVVLLQLSYRSHVGLPMDAFYL